MHHKDKKDEELSARRRNGFLAQYREIGFYISELEISMANMDDSEATMGIKVS